MDQSVDGKEALSKIVDQKGLNYYDIIFLDNLMPNMNGPQTATELRKLGYQHLIIGVTGNALDVDILEFEQAGKMMMMMIHVLSYIIYLPIYIHFSCF